MSSSELRYLIAANELAGAAIIIITQSISVSLTNLFFIFVLLSFLQKLQGYIFTLFPQVNYIILKYEKSSLKNYHPVSSLR